MNEFRAHIVVGGIIAAAVDPSCGVALIAKFAADFVWQSENRC